MNQYIITWILHQIFMYFDKAITVRSKGDLTFVSEPELGQTIFWEGVFIPLPPKKIFFLLFWNSNLKWDEVDFSPPFP